MKAVCVRSDRTLEVRDLPTPAAPPAEHLLVAVEACAINHGDKTFLARPPMALAPRSNDVWGASGAGRVVALGAGVPPHYAGRRVAIYHSLCPTPETVGVWCETAQVHHRCCLVLPDRAQPEDHSGSLVNVFTAHAFLRQAAADGCGGIVATAGGAATGRALAALARGRDVPVISLVRSAAARAALQAEGVQHVLATGDPDFGQAFAELAQRLRATAVFDGIGGALVGVLAPLVPQDTVFSFYGFLAGNEPAPVATSLFMAKNLVMRRFSNFNSATARDPAALEAALAELRSGADDPLRRTRVGRVFRFDEIAEAMRFEAASGYKAVLVA